MKYWVITRKNDGYEFHRVEANTMSEAVEQVEKGLMVVSPFFKTNYPKYERMWNKIDKKYRQLKEEDIDTLLGNSYYVDGHQIYLDAVMYNKNSVQFDFVNFNVNVCSLSDYNFEEVLNYMKGLVDVL